MVYSIDRWWCRPKRTRVVQNRSKKLKTVVYNRSMLPLTIKDYYIHVEGTAYYGGEEFRIPAGMRKAIHSGKFLKEYMAYKDYQEIHVMSGEQVLHKLRHDEFHVNRGNELLLDMKDNRSRYAFVHPAQGINDAQWIWSSKF